MRIILWISLITSALILSRCDLNEKPAIPTSVADLSDADSTKLMAELIDSMCAEAKQNLDENCALEINDIPPSCWDDRHILEIKMNAQNQLLIRGKPSKFENIEEEVYQFYTMNRDLSEKEVEEKISSKAYEGYNFPFYSFTSEDEIKRHIIESREHKKSTQEHGNLEMAQFYEKTLTEWEEKHFAIKVLNVETIQEVHPQTYILIDIRADSSGWSKPAEAALYGMYRVRNLACMDYFGISYLDLFLKAKTTGKQKYKDQLQAIEIIYDLRIQDAPYIRSIDCKNALIDPDHVYFSEEEVLAPPVPFDPND